MKTAKNQNNFPTPIRFFSYLVAVAAFCILNWTTLKAVEKSNAKSAIEIIFETEIQAEYGMTALNGFSEESMIAGLFE